MTEVRDETPVNAWCGICGERFNAFEWDRRHSYQNLDVHEDCCPEPDCVAERAS